MPEYVAAGNLPRHRYVTVQTSFLRTGKLDPKGRRYEPAVWFGLTARPGRARGCNVMLECGAVYRDLPLHALARDDTRRIRRHWRLDQAQQWNCYGERFATLSYDYLDGLRCYVRAGSDEFTGEYWFTAVPIGDGYTAAPEQAKEFLFIGLDNGRLTVQPTNRVLFLDRSFTLPGSTWPKDLKVSTEAWNSER